MITAIYLVHNRIEFVRESFPAFMRECDNELVKNVMVYDDLSTDGSSEFIVGLIKDNPKYNYTRQFIGTSWKQINATYPIAQDWIFKMDNDIVPPEGYLQNLVDVIQSHSNIGFVGYHTSTEAKLGGTDVSDARHIGGVGLFKTSAIRVLGGVKESIFIGEKRFHGFTALQEKSLFRKCWVKDASVIDLSMVHRELQSDYIEKGYTRPVVS